MTVEMCSRVWNAMMNVFRDRRGTVAVMTALMIVPLVGAMTIATEAASWVMVKHAMQDTADAAALAAAENNNTTTVAGGPSAEAIAVAKKYGFVNGQNNTTVTVTGPTTFSGVSACSSGTCYSVVITKNMPLLLSEVVGYNGNVAIGHGRGQALQAGAIANSTGSGGVCVLALDNRSADIHSIFGGNSANVTIGGTCEVFDDLNNSKDGDTVDVKSGATLNFYKLGMKAAVKCDGASPGTCDGTLTTTKPIQYGKSTIADPYSGLTIPAATGTCTQTNYVVSTTTTLPAGTYCSTGGNAALTISPPAGTTLKTSTMIMGMGTTNVLSFMMAMSMSGVSVGMTVSDTTHTSAIPSGTTVTAVNTAAKTVTISNYVSGGMTGVNNNDNIAFSSAPITVTLSGTYILDGQGGGTGASACTGSTKPSGCLSGDLVISGNATATGSGVTIVLTSSTCKTTCVAIDIGNVYITNGGALTISSPAEDGIAIWQDSHAPNPSKTDGNSYATTSPYSDGVNVFSGATANISGVIYFPSQGLLFTGGSSSDACTQIVSFTVVFQGSSSWDFPSDCTSSTGEAAIGGNAVLVD